MCERILLVNRLVGYGKMTLGMMVPVLSYLGYDVQMLPTALSSNAPYYDEFTSVDTTEFLRGALAAWGKNGFEFDAVSTGFVNSCVQADLIAAFLEGRVGHDMPLFVDPVLANAGQLLIGVDEEKIEAQRRLASLASVVCPNYTEACLLTGIPYREEGVDDAGARELVDSLRSMGAKSVVVTRVVYEGHDSVIGWDHALGEHFDIEFTRAPVRFLGVGDVFQSVLIARVLEGLTLEGATAEAVRLTRNMVLRCLPDRDPREGLPIESLLDVLDDLEEL